jgi:hypothetical protein
MAFDLLINGARWVRRPNDGIIFGNSIVSGPQPAPSRQDAER